MPHTIVNFHLLSANPLPVLAPFLNSLSAFAAVKCLNASALQALKTLEPKVPEYHRPRHNVLSEQAHDHRVIFHTPVQSWGPIQYWAATSDPIVRGSGAQVTEFLGHGALPVVLQYLNFGAGVGPKSAFEFQAQDFYMATDERVWMLSGGVYHIPNAADVGHRWLPFQNLSQECGLCRYQETAQMAVRSGFIRPTCPGFSPQPTPWSSQNVAWSAASVPPVPLPSTAAPTANAYRVMNWASSTPTPSLDPVREMTYHSGAPLGGCECGAEKTYGPGRARGLHSSWCPGR